MARRNVPHANDKKPHQDLEYDPGFRLFKLKHLMNGSARQDILPAEGITTNVDYTAFEHGR